MIAFLFSRHLRRGNPTTVFYTYAGLFAVFYSMTATLSLLYMATIVGLSPFQMVMVGTVLEATIFVCEVPTGLLSDLHSRRLSIVVGLVLIGIGFLMQPLLPTFGGILAAQIVWGVGFTFVSGSDEAWLADEIGAERITPVFVHAKQIELAGTIIGTISAAGLGLIGLQIPLVVSGAGFLVVAGMLCLFMSENGFVRTEESTAAPLRSMVAVFHSGIAVARRKPIVRSFLIISVLAGLSSEAFDRLWTVRILDAFQLPSLPGTGDGEVLVFAGIALVGTIVSLLVSVLLKHLQPERLAAAHPAGLLMVLTTCQIGGILGLALSGNLWFALAALWLRAAALSIAAPLQSAWLARNLDSTSRATSLSLISQANAIGQVTGGPPLGALANKVGVPIALVLSALVLTPTIGLFSRARKTTEPNRDDTPNKGTTGHEPK